MPRSLIVPAVLMACQLAFVAQGAEQPSAAARAATVAPFVNAQTVGVVYVDFSQVPINPLFDIKARLFGEAFDGLERDKEESAHILAELKKLGVREAYLVASLPAGEPRPPIIMLKLEPATDVAAVQTAVHGGAPATRKVGDVLLLAAEDETLAQQAKIAPESRPELTKAFEAAGNAAVQIAILPPKYFAKVVDQMLPELPQQFGGGASTVLTRGAQWGAIGVDISPRLALRTVVQSKDAAAAAALQQKIAEVTQLAAELPEVKKLLPNLDEAAAKLLPKAENDQLIVTLDDAGIQGLEDLLQPFYRQARLSAKRAMSMNNLKQIGLAMHNHHDVYKTFPPAAKCDKDGKPLLSWRVLILPFLEETPLYQQFHLDEPWDSPHNKTLIDKMPAIYRSPLTKLADKSRTNYVLPVGPAAAFDGAKALVLKDLKDGSSNTIMTLEVDDDAAVVWSKPDDLSFDPLLPLKDLGHLLDGGFEAGFMDGSVRLLRNTIPPATMKALVTPAGGEAIDPAAF